VNSGAGADAAELVDSAGEYVKLSSKRESGRRERRAASIVRNNYWSTLVARTAGTKSASVGILDRPRGRSVKSSWTKSLMTAVGTAHRHLRYQ
jgi:hypothetical protein